MLEVTLILQPEYVVTIIFIKTVILMVHDAMDHNLRRYVSFVLLNLYGIFFKISDQTNFKSFIYSLYFHVLMVLSFEHVIIESSTFTASPTISAV